MGRGKYYIVPEINLTERLEDVICSSQVGNEGLTDDEWGNNGGASIF